MSKPAARVGDMTTPPHGPLVPGIGSVNVLIGNKPAWRAQADSMLCPFVKGVVPDVGGMVLLGSLGVYTNNFMQARVGDIVVEIPGGPNPIMMGQMNVLVGEIMPAPPVTPPVIVFVPQPVVAPPAASGPSAGASGVGSSSSSAGRPAPYRQGGAAGSAQGQTMSAAKKSGAPFTKCNCNKK